MLGVGFRDSWRTSFVVHALMFSVALEGFRVNKGMFRCCESQSVFCKLSFCNRASVFSQSCDRALAIRQSRFCHCAFANLRLFFCACILTSCFCKGPIVPLQLCSCNIGCLQFRNCDFAIVFLHISKLTLCFIVQSCIRRPKG